MVEKLDYKLYAHFKKRKLLYLQLVQQTSLFYFSGILRGKKDFAHLLQHTIEELMVFYSCMMLRIKYVSFFTVGFN